MLWKVYEKKTYHYDEGRELVTNFLRNLKLNWLNFSVLLSDHAEGISIVYVKSAMQTKLIFFPRHASRLYRKFQREKTSGNENHELPEVTCYFHAVYQKLRVTFMLCTRSYVLLSCCVSEVTCYFHAVYQKLHVTFMLCIRVNDNKLLPYVILNRKTMSKDFFLQRCNSSGPKMHGWHRS
jgi:hypothetical protein